MAQTTEELLTERGKVHGKYLDHAHATQALKTILRIELQRRAARGQPPLSLCQIESLDMIVHKIGRILAGDADHADHWDDIAGYAKLITTGASQ